MCGFVLGATRQEGGLVLADLSSATNRLRHRGPDDEGYLLVDLEARRAFAAAGYDTVASLGLPQIKSFQAQRINAALGFRRLSIQDLSKKGHQPLGSEDGSVWLAFNGEIYNFIELRAELQKEGVTFKSGSDTEVLLAAYSQWGLACLDRLIGMWAFALIDLRKRRVLVCRDPFGIKPLFWTIHRGVFWAGSEIKALSKLPGFTARVNPQALNDYLRHGLGEQGGLTLYSGIHSLPPGTWMEIREDGPSDAPPQPVQYCDLEASLGSPKWDGGDVHAAADAVRREFLRSVELHMRSDVGYGCLLSGGLDSSSIVAAAAHLRRGAADFDTFTYASGDAYDESAIAAKVAVDVGCRNYRLSLEGTDFASYLEKATLAQDEPIVGPSILAQYQLFELVRARGTKVVLDGQGGDELMGGYPWYLGTCVASSLRRGQFGSAAKLLSRWVSQGGSPGAFSSMARFAIPGKYHWRFRRAIGMSGVEQWMNRAWFREREITEELDWNCRPGDPFTSVRVMEVRTNLRELLRFEDRNSMAHSVESRVPFLTVPLARLAFSMPSDFLISSEGSYKHVFRLAMDGLTPDYVINRTDKVGFNAPEIRLLVQNRAYLLKQLSNGNQLFDAALNRSSLASSLTDPTLTAQSAHYLWRVLAAVEWIRCCDVSVS